MRIPSLTLLLGLLVTGTSYAQQAAEPATCAPIAGKSYHPLDLNSQARYQIVGGTPYKVIMAAAPTKIDGKNYVEQLISYLKTGVDEVAYYRQDGEAVMSRTLTTSESVEIPAPLVKGRVWYEADSTWRYTIVNTSETLATPACRYTDCLRIQQEEMAPEGDGGRTVKAVTQQFYQRGRGVVGVVTDGKLTAYRLLDK